MYSTDFCPRNEAEWKERSNILKCTEQNGYTCLPNEQFTELLEFCYTDPWILIEEGKIASYAVLFLIIDPLISIIFCRRIVLRKKLINL